MTPGHCWDTHLFKGIQQIAYCLLLVQLLHLSLLLWHRHGDWEERQGGEGQGPSQSPATLTPAPVSPVRPQLTPDELHDRAAGSHGDMVLPPQHSPVPKHAVCPPGHLQPCGSYTQPIKHATP